MLNLVIGVIHVGNKLTKVCGNADTETCFGPWLFWQKDGDGLSDVNGSYWRSVFSFNTSVFFDLWTPIFLGLVLLHSSVPGLMDSKHEFEADQWRWLFLVFLITALFGSFGYSGNLGVIGGFVNVLASVVCFIAGSR